MTEIDYEQARFNMIEQQIRPWEVLDDRVLAVMARVPREDFVPEQYRNLAFSDVRIPLSHGQTMMNPNVEGRLLQALLLTPGDSVLEVGTGSGYLTACLAALGGSVRSVDIHPDFTEAATRKLRAHGIDNVRLETGDAVLGWGARRYDAIALTGALPELPDGWRRQLAVGGRLFVIVGEPPIMEARLVTRVGEREWSEDSLFDTEIPYLANAARPREFVF